MLTSNTSEEFPSQQAELLKSAIKRLRGYLDAEAPSLNLPARLLKDQETANLQFHDCAMKTRAGRGWVATLPSTPSGTVLLDDLIDLIRPGALRGRDRDRLADPIIVGG